MKFLKRMAKYLAARIEKLVKMIDKHLFETEIKYTDKVTGEELTSPLIEIAVRRAVSAAILAVGTALDARIPKESQISVPVYSTFTRLSNEAWHGGFQ